MFRPDPESHIAYEYYPDGELKTVPDGFSTFSNSYDRLNRPTYQVAQFGNLQSEIDNAYDAVGNVTNTVVSIGNPQSKIGNAYAYDAAERLTDIVSDREDATAQRFVYAYNPENGKVASVSNTVSGLVCAYAYDLMDRATNIVYALGTNEIRSLEYEYDDLSMITKKRQALGNGQEAIVNYTYDRLDRLVHESTRGGLASLRETSYSYDLAGNRLSKVSNGVATTYVLGIGNRLASSSTTSNSSCFVSGASSEPIGLDNRWGYLAISNLTTGTGVVPDVNGCSFFANIPAVSGSTNTVVAAIRDHAGNMGFATNDYWVGISEHTEDTQVIYSYDAAGCLTNLNGVSLEWDERYRLLNVDGASCSVAYAYDVLGRRVSRIENGSTNFFVYNGNQVVADLDGAGNVLRTYVWGSGIDNLLCFTDHATSNTYYAIKDHQNTVIVLVDETGAVVESYEYSAYGEILDVKDGLGNSIGNRQSELGNRYTFQGREIDWTTGLYYFRARWYDPVAGRWLSKDPIGISGGLNLYEALGGNPIYYRDPIGEDLSWGEATSDVTGWGHTKVQVENSGLQYGLSFGPTSDSLWDKAFGSGTGPNGGGKKDGQVYDNTGSDWKKIHETFKTTPEEDRLIKHIMEKVFLGEKGAYGFFGNNCREASKYMYNFLKDMIEFRRERNAGGCKE